MSAMDRRRFLGLTAAGIPLAATVTGAEVSARGASEIPAEQRSGPWLEVDFGAIAWNVAQLRGLIGKRPIIGIIKCNAYGHGVVEVARFLEGAGIDALAVASAGDAIVLREAGISCPLLNLGPLSPAEAVEVVRLGISQSVYTPQFEELARIAAGLGKPARIQIKVDTGLGRVGVPYHNALDLIRHAAGLRQVEIEGIFTVMTEEAEFDREQLLRFGDLCETLRREGIRFGMRHAVSSAGIIDLPEGYLDAVRPGIALYGHYPSERAREERKIDLKPAMQLKAPVLYVKRLRPGDGVSYHRPFRAEREIFVATIGIGYSDGLPRQLVEGGEVLIGGKRRPLVAAVTSNHCSANLFDDGEVGVGDEAVLFGSQGGEEIPAEEVAALGGASIYSLLIGMNPRLNRRYLTS